MTFKVTQSHQRWCHLKQHTALPISNYDSHVSVLHCFKYTTSCSEIVYMIAHDPEQSLNLEKWQTTLTKWRFSRKTRVNNIGTRMPPFWILLDYDDGVVVTTACIRRAKLQSNCHHQHTCQHPTVYGLDALPVAQPTVSEHWSESITFHELAHTKLIWGLPSLSWLVKAPGYLGGGLPSILPALWH